jgi:ubiquinone biosynthesis protein
MLKALSDYGRLLRAGTALGRHDVILPDAFRSRLPLPARIAGRVLRLFGGGSKGRPGERLARALESLGPAYIKLGQFLATRPDVFGGQVTDDLGRLKDRLPPFSESEARAALAAEFGEADASQLFPQIGAPVAAASLAQVHRMVMPDGARAVKILRPRIEGELKRELSAMQRAARTIEIVSADSRRLKPSAFMETIAQAMMRETDLRLEAGGADELASLSRESGYFRIPRVDWERTGRRVLTSEWIEGRALTDPEALTPPGLDRVKLANDITRGFLTYAIEHGVFHADMHEGNIIITPEGSVALVDFGIIGRIGMMERRFLAEILLGFLKRDYQRIAEVHFEAGYVPASQSVGEFAQALRSIGEPVHGRPAEEVSMGRVILQLFDYTETFGMQLRPELVLLQKTMVQVEGVARRIDPSHNIWTAAAPVIEAWRAKRFGPEGAAKLVGENLRDVASRLARLPHVMDRLEASLEREAPPPAPQRFAPWWGWFGLAGVIAAAAAWALRAFS